jgi:hypothetical protein
VAARERRGRGARRWGLADEEGRDEGRFRQRMEGETPATAAMVAAGTGVEGRRRGGWEREFLYEIHACEREIFFEPQHRTG